MRKLRQSGLEPMMMIIFIIISTFIIVFIIIITIITNLRKYPVCYKELTVLYIYRNKDNPHNIYRPRIGLCQGQNICTI